MFSTVYMMYKPDLTLDYYLHCRELDKSDPQRGSIIKIFTKLSAFYSILFYYKPRLIVLMPRNLPYIMVLYVLIVSPKTEFNI